MQHQPDPADVLCARCRGESREQARQTQATPWSLQHDGLPRFPHPVGAPPLATPVQVGASYTMTMELSARTAAKPAATGVPCGKAISRAATVAWAPQWRQNQVSAVSGRLTGGQ